MKKMLFLSLMVIPFLLAFSKTPEEIGPGIKPVHHLLYQGHGSLRIVTADKKVIYIDPYAGEGYDLPADLILVSHGHPDHNKVDLIEKRNEDCKVIYNTDALVNGVYNLFDLGYAIVEPVQAGNNKNHDINVCVGWVITFPDDVPVPPYRLPIKCFSTN